MEHVKELDEDQRYACVVCDAALGMTKDFKMYTLTTKFAEIFYFTLRFAR